MVNDPIQHRIDQNNIYVTRAAIETRKRIEPEALISAADDYDALSALLDTENEPGDVFVRAAYVASVVLTTRDQLQRFRDALARTLQSVIELNFSESDNEHLLDESDEL